MNEIVEMSRGEYAIMCFFLGLLVGLFVCPFIMWLVKQIKKVLEE